MKSAEACRLWLTRVLEGQLGLVRFLVETGDTRLLSRWLTIQAGVDADLESLVGSTDTGAARRLFFSSQALMEKFVIEEISYDAMTDWVAHSADVHRSLTPMAEPALEFPERLGNQLRLYDSEVDTGDSYTSIRDCGIWAYREQRRAAGVPITLKSPCEFCVRSVTANASAQQLTATVALRDDAAEPGCDWRFAHV